MTCTARNFIIWSLVGLGIIWMTIFGSKFLVLTLIFIFIIDCNKLNFNVGEESLVDPLWTLDEDRIGLNPLLCDMFIYWITQGSFSPWDYYVLTYKLLVQIWFLFHLIKNICAFFFWVDWSFRKEIIIRYNDRR